MYRSSQHAFQFCFFSFFYSKWSRQFRRCQRRNKHVHQILVTLVARFKPDYGINWACWSLYRHSKHQCWTRLLHLEVGVEVGRGEGCLLQTHWSLAMFRAIFVTKPHHPRQHIARKWRKFEKQKSTHSDSLFFIGGKNKTTANKQDLENAEAATAPWT